MVDAGITSEALVRLQRLHIVDQAEALISISSDAQVALLYALPSRGVGALLQALDANDAVSICYALGIDKLSKVLDFTSPDVAADALRGLSDETADEALAAMKTAQDVIPLLEFEDDAAGGLMTLEFIALRETMNVARALEFVRLWADEIGPDPEYIHYPFVVDWSGALKGGLSLAQLVLRGRVSIFRC